MNDGDQDGQRNQQHPTNDYQNQRVETLKVPFVYINQIIEIYIFTNFDFWNMASKKNNVIFCQQMKNKSQFF